MKEHIWKSSSLVKKYLSGVRGAIPLASEQLDIVMRLISKAEKPTGTFLDIGCGDGVLAATILERYQGMKGVCLDFSEPMLDAAQEKLKEYSTNLKFILLDYGERNWTQRVEAMTTFDLVVSGFSIHHQPDERKKELYNEIFDLLVPGGLFLNIEHVLSPTKWIESVFDNQFIDNLYQMHLTFEPETTREKVAQEYYRRPDKEANILAPVEKQCDWLREIGFGDVDCYFKVFELAIFGGRKPMTFSGATPGDT